MNNPPQTTPREHQDKEPFRLLSVFYFTDGLCSFSNLHTGTLEECRRMMEMIPAVSYDGDKQIKESILKICDKDQWAELQEIGHA